jgi:hypothetical protein
MYHCRKTIGPNGGSTGAIWGIPVDSRTSFAVGDIVAVFNPVNNDQITAASRIYEIIPVPKSSAGTLFLQVLGGGTNGIVFSNQIIQQGYEVRVLGGSLVSSTISGPFSSYVDNQGITVQGRGIIEENYNETRHQLLNYDVSNTEIPTATNCKNASFMSGTPWNSYHFSGLVTTGRVNNAPNTGWNGKGCRIAHMLTSQHMIFNGHYPPMRDVAYIIDANGNRQTRKRRTPQEVGASGGGTDPYATAFKVGVMAVTTYPFWFALKNPGLDITDVLDVPFETFQSFTLELVIQTIKIPVNIIKPKIPFMKTNMFSSAYHQLNYTNRTIKASPCLLIQSSFFTGYSAVSFANFNVNNNQIAFGIQQQPTELTWTNKPGWYTHTDEFNQIQVGDSSSLVFWYFDRNDGSQPNILLPLTGILSGGTTNALNVNGTFDYPTFTGLNGSTVTSTFETHLYTATLSTGSAPVLNENQKKVLEFILRDKSWQITPESFLSADPEKNIYSDDIVDTSVNWYDVSNPEESLPPITNEQLFTLRSGVNLVTTNPAFTRFKIEDRFTNENVFSFGTSFENENEIYLGTSTYRFNRKGYNIIEETVGIPQLHSRPQIPPDISSDFKLSIITFRRATTKDLIPLQSDPNTLISVFRFGGNLTQDRVLTPVDMEFHRSGAKLIKKKLK